MLSTKAILERLRPLGFCPAWAERYTRFSRTYRRCREDTLFEFVDIEAAGKRGEAVHAIVRLSPLKNFYPDKPFPHALQYIHALGALDLDADAAGDRWLSSLPGAVDAALVDLTREYAAGMVAESTRPSELAAWILAQVRRHSDERMLPYLENQLEQKASAEQRALASRFTSIDNRVPDLERARHVGLLGLLLHDGELPAQELSIDPSKTLRDQSLLWTTIEFVADLLLTLAEDEGAELGGTAGRSRE